MEEKYRDIVEKLNKISSLKKRITFLEDCKQKETEDSLQTLIQGRIHQEKKEYNKAELLFQQLLKTGLEAAVIKHELGNVYGGQKKYEEAEKYYHLAIQKDADFSYPYNALGVLYADQKKYEEAEKYYHLAIQKNEEYIWPYNNLGVLYAD